MAKPADAITPVQQIISSCAGAMLTAVFMTPLDVVKIRLQAQRKPFQVGSCFIYSNGLMDCLCVCSHCHDKAKLQKPTSPPQLPAWYERPGHFSGTMDAFVKISRNEGVTALWSGLPPTLLMSVPATVAYFTIYDRLKYAMGYDELNPSTKYIPVVAGSLARAVAVTLISPLELLRTKRQSKQLSYFQLREALAIGVKENGVTFLMKGLGPSLLRDIPFSAMYWFGYELTKSYQLRHQEAAELNFFITFISGAICGSLAALLTLPFDVVKTHRQIELGEAETRGTMKSPTSTWWVMSELYGKQGLSALYAGIVPRMIKVAPACAIMITVYEYCKAFFREQNKEKQS